MNGFIRSRGTFLGLVFGAIAGAQTSALQKARDAPAPPISTDIGVRSEQKISDTAGGFGGALENLTYFGSSVAGLGDLDGDGTGDLAVGAFGDGGIAPTNGRGAVWVLFLNQEGMVRTEQKINNNAGGFEGTLDLGDHFGISVASLGDLDGDGIPDLAVGASSDDDGGTDRGAVWILFLNSDGTVRADQKISDTAGGFQGLLADGDHFGRSVANLGDLDGDGTHDLAVGATGDAGGGFSRGAVWVLFLNSDGTVKTEQKISDTAGGFQGTLDNGDLFGSSVASLGDLDEDGTQDLAVGAVLDDDGGGSPFADRGAVWVLFLNPDGTVKAEQKISDTAGGLQGMLGDSDFFGISVARLGDLDGDGVEDLAVGAVGDDDGGLSSNRGAVWMLFLNPDGTVKAEQKVSDTAGGFEGTLDDFDQFGYSIALLDDLDGHGVADLAVGAVGDDDGGSGLSADRGAVWMIFLKNRLVLTR